MTDNAFAAAANLFAKGDGIDTLWNIENLRFCLGNDPVTKNCNSFTDVSVSPPSAPGNVTATAGNRTATVTWTRPTADGAATLELRLRREVRCHRHQHDEARADDARSHRDRADPRAEVHVRGAWGQQFGAGPFGVSNEITAVGTPNPPTALVATRSNGSASLSWTPGADNSSAITGYNLQIRNGAAVVETRTITGNVSSAVISGLNNGTAYNFRLQAINGIGTSALSTASNTVTPATLPGLVQIGAPTQGPAGGALTASANWNPPLSNGGATITNYRVKALRMAADGTTVLSVEGDVTVGATVRTRSFTLPAGSYRFDVSAINGVGEGPAVRSEAIAAR